jgi:uncharacterized protein YdiU (UPF0061 family)
VFEYTFADELERLYVDWQPADFPEAVTLASNADLAAELGIDAVPASARPIAMAYAGHQFGGYSPRLGDGRALLLGELVDVTGRRRDVHLKGSGRTPFARGGDGKAAVGPMLREYLMGEAMHALGIPTTRALSVVYTGEQIVRDGGLLPGAVLTRVASSHIRVGTFEYAARLGEPEVLKRLVDYSIRRHHPDAAGAERPALALLDSVLEAQASLVARWMLVGFIHGVMNTDNMTISGETIDYGPCAFLDRFDPATVYSSIDHGGRYAFGNQPSIAQWNLTRLAETLLTLIDADTEQAVALATEALTTFSARFRHHWRAGMRAKLGLVAEHADDQVLFDDLLALMYEQRADHTSMFRQLAVGAREGLADARLAAFGPWLERWHARLAAQARPAVSVADDMDAVNPIYIPRNHLVEEALAAATDGDVGPFHELLDFVSRPFTARPEGAAFASPAAEQFAASYQTFCGT